MDFNLIDFNELRQRITLCDISVTRDEEMNVIESLTPFRTVWAKVETKAATNDSTPSGVRPELRYKITCRYDKKLLQRKLAVMYDKKRLYQTAPPYADGIYIIFTATEQVKK